MAAYGDDWFKFDELQLLTETGWRLQSLFEGWARIDQYERVIDLVLNAVDPSGKLCGLNVYPEDGQLWDDLVRTIKADYRQQIEDAAYYAEQTRLIREAA